MKKLQILFLYLLFGMVGSAQTNLPTSWNFSNPGIANPPAGWTLGLGTNGNLTYAFGIGDNLSARLDATGEYIMIQFSDKPGPLSYYLSPQNAGLAWGGQFDIQESTDGVNWSTLRSVTSKSSTATNYTGGRYQENLAPASRYVRFYYTTKLPGGSAGGGNMGVDSVMIQQAPAPPYPNINVKKGSTYLISGSTHVIGNAALTQFVIENKGTADTLRIDSIRFYGNAASDFSFGSMPSSIAPNGSGSLGLIFGPSANGSRLATMRIYCNDTVKSPFELDLYAIGGSFATEPTSYPTGVSFSNIKSYAFDVKFAYTGAKPEKFIVLRRKGNSTATPPVDGASYKKGDYIGEWQVEKICDSIETIIPTYIHALSTYYYTVYSFNGPAGFENYNQTNYASGSVSTNGKSFGSYYNGIDPGNANFVSALSAKINPHDTIYYSNYISRVVNPWLSRDTTGGQKVVSCVYTNHQFVYNEPFLWANGTNGAVLTREHTWPQSWMPSNVGNPDWPNAPGTSKELPEYSDIHNLFPAHQLNANARRSNNPFDEVLTPTYTSPTGLGVLGKDSANRTTYEPRPEHKGDVARALFYMAVCYNGASGKNWSLPAQQNLALLREWNRQDPPDNFEIARHEFAAAQQGNRNPFIDHPEWADRINFYTMSYIADTAGTTPVLSVINPLASETWMKGKSAKVSWSYQHVDTIQIYFSEDSLKTGILLATVAANTDSFVYMVPSVFSHTNGIIVIKDKKSNVADTSDYFKLSMVDGVNESGLLRDAISVFPNPSHDLISISGLNSNVNYSFDLYDSFGQKVLTKLVINKHQINIEDLEQGVYFLNISANNEMKVFRIIKF